MIFTENLVVKIRAFVTDFRGLVRKQEVFSFITFETNKLDISNF